jgi:hypothetical protein
MCWAIRSAKLCLFILDKQRHGEGILMKKMTTVIAAALLAGAAFLPLQSANAFFGGWPGWGGYGWGGYGWGGGPWGWGGYPGWGGWGYPYYGGWGYPYGGWGGYPYYGGLGYGYPYALTAPVVVTQPTTEKK